MAKKKSEEILEKLLSRQEFRYDPNGDALYKQYRDRYQELGRKAMSDTVGKVTSLTGGYGSSYAQTAGQQTYGEYMKALADKVPGLYSLALETYTRQGERLKGDYDLVKGQEAEEAAAEQREYDRWLQERDYNYKAEQDAADREQALKEAEAEERRWQAEFEEAKRQFEIKQAGKGASSSGSGGSGGKKELTDAQVRQIIKYGEQRDRKGMQIYLASLQEAGRITREEADWLFRQYWGSGGTDNRPAKPVTQLLHTK